MRVKLQNGSSLRVKLAYLVSETSSLDAYVERHRCWKWAGEEMRRGEMRLQIWLKSIVFSFKDGNFDEGFWNLQNLLR